jgi:hypothetical protein
MSVASHHPAGAGILAIWTDIAPELEADFNEWYWREHFPERLSVPGFRSGRRYRATAGAPRYFAWYELETPEILASPAYLERLDHPSAWTSRVMPGFRNTTRAVLRRALCVGRAAGGVMLTVRPGPGGQAVPEAALLQRLAAGAGIVRVQLRRSASLASPATREGYLRGNVDQSVAWALAVEAAADEDLPAARRLLDAALPEPGEAATYRFLSGLDASD